MIHEYQPEILSIFPDKLAKSPLILDSVASCFPAGLPLIYSADRIQLYPRTQNAVKLGQIAAQLHKFEVQLDDQHTVYCYALTFYVRSKPWLRKLPTFSISRRWLGSARRCWHPS